MLQLRPVARKFIELKNGVEAWKFPGEKYFVAKVWEELRPKQDKVTWNRFLRSSMAIPKHVFISWIAILNRLPTMDRLVSWGLIERGECCFYQNVLETQDHLFFECNYSKNLWKSILQLCDLNREVGNWDSELEWALRRIKGKALISLILRIAWKTYIYIMYGGRETEEFMVIHQHLSCKFLKK